MKKLPFESIEFRLPIGVDEQATIHVAVGSKVKAGDEVGRWLVKQVREIHLDKEFGTQDAKQIKEYLKKAEGEPVSAGEVIAESKSFWKKKVLVAKDNGVVQFVTNTLLTIESVEQDVSYVTPMGGRVVRVEPEMVEVEAMAMCVEGGKSRGGMRWGVMECMADEVARRLETIGASVRDKIMVMPTMLPQAVWYKLGALGCAGVVCPELPPDFERWQGTDTMPAVFSLEGDTSEDWIGLWSWLKKREGSLAFILGDQKRLVVVKGS